MNAKTFPLPFQIEGRRSGNGASAHNQPERQSIDKRLLFALLALVVMPSIACAQVVVGLGNEAERAALLELKTQSADANNISSVSDDANVTSTRGGLVLPRVRLISPTTLEPFIAATDPDWASNVGKIKEIHTGLSVYNLTFDANFIPGVYVWNGTQWVMSTSVNIEIGSGLTISGSNIDIGGKLTRSVAIDNNTRQVAVNGQGEVNVGAPLFLSRTLKYIDGNQAKGKLLMSDKHGYASWQPQTALPPTPTAVFTADGAGAAANVNLRDYVGPGKWKDTNASITLPPGRWFVMVTMRTNITQDQLADDDWLWMTTTFIAENETLPNASYFEGNNNLISGRLYKSLVTINGYVIINNRSTSAIKFKYHFGEIELGKVKANIPIPLDKFASSAWQENIIVAFALVE